ncbi:MAG TPA: hypothetical protein VIC24_07985 [Gemmatimonadaceae bacterium]|jgi:hypothetical protein
MTDAANKTTTVEQPAVERRSNVVLRSLVNEMLQRVRDLSRRTAAWSVEERTQAEAELERIMSRVRDEASRSRATR